MYGQVLGASATVTGVAGVAVLPNTGATKVLFTIALSILSLGIVALVATTAMAVKQRSTKG